MRSWGLSKAVSANYSESNGKDSDEVVPIWEPSDAKIAATSFSKLNPSFCSLLDCNEGSEPACAVTVRLTCSEGWRFMISRRNPHRGETSTSALVTLLSTKDMPVRPEWREEQCMCPCGFTISIYLCNSPKLEIKADSVTFHVTARFGALKQILQLCPGQNWGTGALPPWLPFTGAADGRDFSAGHCGP